MSGHGLPVEMKVNDKVVDMEGDGGLGCESSSGYGCGCVERGATPFKFEF